jgi:NAD(P)-dependent dehydrogenase (short-subunit alcohol dehydrogenase family)
MEKIWFITGVSSGFGQELSKAVIAKGDKIIATFRAVAAWESTCTSHKGQAGTGSSRCTSQ